MRFNENFTLFQEYTETMTYNLIQKAARSSCINKSRYLLDKMMQVRNKSNSNISNPVFDKSRREDDFFHQELSQQETEFLMLSKVQYTKSINTRFYAHNFQDKLRIY